MVLEPALQEALDLMGVLPTMTLVGNSLKMNTTGTNLEIVIRRTTATGV